MAERVGDLDDVRDRTVARLLGQPLPGVPERDTPFILVADDLAPADTVTLTPERVLALVTVSGGPTSHTAILARSLGLPAVVACAGGRRRCARASSSRSTGHGPGPRRDRAGRGRGHEPRASGSAGRRGPRAAGPVGRPTATRSRCSSTSATPPGAAAVAQGRRRGRRAVPHRVPLPRSPGRAVGRRAGRPLHGVLEAMGGRKIVVRTLDAGADKPLPFLNPDDEPNPALGVRGLRTARRSPEVLDGPARRAGRSPSRRRAPWSG